MVIKNPGPEHCNKIIHDKSIYQYFKRNPQVYNSLKEDVKKKLNIGRGYLEFPKSRMVMVAVGVCTFSLQKHQKLS